MACALAARGAEARRGARPLLCCRGANFGNQPWRTRVRRQRPEPETGPAPWPCGSQGRKLHCPKTGSRPRVRAGPLPGRESAARHKTCVRRKRFGPGSRSTRGSTSIGTPGRPAVGGGGGFEGGLLAPSGGGEAARRRFGRLWETRGVYPRFPAPSRRRGRGGKRAPTKRRRWPTGRRRRVGAGAIAVGRRRPPCGPVSPAPCRLAMGDSAEGRTATKRPGAAAVNVGGLVRGELLRHSRAACFVRNRSMATRVQPGHSMTCAGGHSLPGRKQRRRQLRPNLRCRWRRQGAG